MVSEGGKMKLGEKILQLRKEKSLSQEQLGELINVTRQTISNWELGETSPNPNQLKQLSKIFNISVDELLDNEIKNVLESKMSNTEKLAGMIIKILKFLGIIFLVMFVIEMIAFILFITKGKVTYTKTSEMELSCKIEEAYHITVRSDGYFHCLNCPKELQKELKENIDFDDLEKTVDHINHYFESKGGSCD